MRLGPSGARAALAAAAPTHKVSCPASHGRALLPRRRTSFEVTTMDERFPMTPNCQDKLRSELRHIKEVDRPDNVREIEAALEHGDLRENAEYHAAKERQGALDARLRYLEYRLSRADVIDPATIDSPRIAFGATVTVLDLDNDKRTTYAIVGEDESDAEKGLISITSPIARALIGKGVGDDATVKLPRGEREFEIVDLCYKAISN